MMVNSKVVGPNNLPIEMWIFLEIYRDIEREMTSVQTQYRDIKNFFITIELHQSSTLNSFFFLL